MHTRWAVVAACWALSGAGCSGSGFQSSGGGAGGGGGGGGVPTGSPCSTDDIGVEEPCCGTGTRVCGGDAEFATWSDCTDQATGQTLMCTEDPTPPGVDPTPCMMGELPPAGSFGTEYECYGFSVANNEVYHLDRALQRVTSICASPGGLGPIEAFAINPLTGNSYIVAQDTSDFGQFIPRSGTAVCVWTRMGTFPSASIGGFAFDIHGVLYAGEEGSGTIWRFAQDPVTKDPLASWEIIGTLPNSSEGLAMHPLTDQAYNSDGSTLHIVDLAHPGQSLFSCDLGGGGFESIFFDRDGTLYSTNNGTNEFVRIDVDQAAGTCTTTVLFSSLPAEELEGTDCNTGCSYDTCPCLE